MDLVIHKVVQLQHIDVADRDRAVEDLASTSVCQPFLASVAEAGLAEKRYHIGFTGPVKDRCRHWNAAAKKLALLENLVVIHDVQFTLELLLRIDLGQLFAKRLGIRACACFLGSLADLLAEAASSPSKMGLENLSHIHP